jgi:excinuclease UvrABC nuclease subunit
MFTKLYNQNKYQNFIHNFINNECNFFTFQQQICSMTEQDLFYLALQRVEGVGDIMAKKLLTHCGSAEAVLKQRPLNLLPLMAWVRCYLET